MEDKLVEARRVLDKVKDENYVFLNATRGLLLIREGNINEGRRYYNKAMELAKSTDKNLMALVNQKKHLELGRYYIEKGKSREAMKLLKKGLTFKTEQEYYRKKIEGMIRKTV